MWDMKEHLAENKGILYNQGRSARTNVKKVHMRIFLVQFKQKNWIVHNFFWKFWISATSRQFLFKSCVMILKVLPHTWPTQVSMLFLFTSIHLHAPSMIGKWEKVFYLWRRADGIVQTLQPILTLLKSRELTPATESNIYLLIVSNGCHIIRSGWLQKPPWKLKIRITILLII